MKNIFTFLKNTFSGLFSGETITRLSRVSRLMNLRGVRYLAVVSTVLLVGFGEVWGANGDVLFSQDFSSATAVDYTVNTARAYTSENYNICGTTAASQFTTITCNAKGNCGIGINSATGGNSKSYSGKFGTYANNTSYYWSICKTSNFAATAPTAIKVEFNAAFAYVSSGSNTGVQIAVGSSFSSGLTNSCPALSNCVAGFAWPSNSTIRFAKYAASNGNTAINGSSSTLTDGTSYKYTWVINNTASTLTYTGPDNKSTTVAAGCWDLWVGTTRNLAGVTKATTGMSGTTIQNLYIGSPFGKKHEFILDDITVTDLTPAAACTAPNHVDISGTWDRFGGETISLTATAYSSEGTGSPIADADITGWQWQKLIESTWTDITNGTTDGVTFSGATTKNLQISNCGQGNSGKYRCIVSTGPTCNTASATNTDGSQGFGVKVYTLECYTGGTTTYNFTRDGNNQRGSVEIALSAGTGYEFKIHADSHYGNNGTINEDENNWTFTTGGNNVTVNSGLGGTFTFTIDYSSNGDEPILGVTYPRKRIYLSPGVWDDNGAKFAYNYYRTGGSGGWTDFLTSDDCGMYADIPQWNGVILIPARLKNTTVSPGSWDDRWNQTDDITVTSNNYVTITGWNASDFTYTTYSAPTYTISYNAGTSGSGSKANETKTCGVNFTLPNSAVFTREGYTQTGWTTSDGASQTHALGGSYTANASQTFYPVWTVNQYSVTHTLDGVTASSGATGANAATYGTNYTAVFAATSGHELPETITVSIGGSTKTQGTEYTWNQATGTVTITGSYILGDIVITIEGEFSCPSSGTLYSAATSATGNVSIAASSTVELNNATHSTTVTGGKIYAINGQTEAKNLLTSSGFCMTNNNTIFKLELACQLEEGDTITIDCIGGTKNGDPIGLWVSSSESRPGSAPACSGTSTTTSLVDDMINYTVTSSDEYHGKTVLYIHRAVGTSTYFNNINITRPISCTPPDTPTALGVDSKTSNSAELSWDGKSAGANGYEIALVSATGAGTFDWKDEATAFYTATGLTAGTEYTFKVRYKGGVGQCEYSAVVTVTFTTDGLAPVGDCDELINARATSKTAVTASVGSVSASSMAEGADGLSGEYSYAVKFNSSGAVELTPKAGSSFAAGDSLIVYIYNNNSSSKTTGFKIGDDTYSTSITGGTVHRFAQLLTASNIVSSKVTLRRVDSNGYFVAVIIKRCGLLPPCTTPVIPDLSDQNVCPGDDIAAWDATATNTAAITAAGESIAYSWKKKGNDTELATTASFDLGSSATESQAGTYVITVTVSKAGYASSTASKEVVLSVTSAVEEPTITANKAKVYPGDEVTLTATCGTGGVTWQWFTCTNAAGDGESSIGGATSAAYTIVSAGSVGTYYYKVKATGSCASAAKVYTLNVLAADACDKEFWFAKEADRPDGAATATHITSCPSGSSSASYTASIDGTNYTITGCTGQKTGNVTIVVPADNTGTLYVVVQGSSSRTITLSKSSVQIGQETPANGTWGVFTFDDLEAGTYNLVSSGNINWGIMALKLCPTIACSDATPTATAVNATVCVGGVIEITATGYETGATFQWQKQNASTSAWENITDSTRATLRYASATTGNAGKYQVVATKTCSRTSNTVTIAVPAVPVFGAITSPRSVMTTADLLIDDVEATDATGYEWYKSTNSTFDISEDTKIGTTQTLTISEVTEAAGSTFYLFCVASNSCGSTTSSAITVNVTAYVEEDCATKGNEDGAEFGFENTSCGSGNFPNTSTPCWNSNSKTKYLTYTAPDGKYFSKAKVTVGVSGGTTAAYGYSTDGSLWTYVTLTGLAKSLDEKEIVLPASVTHFRIGRNFDPDYGQTSNTFYLSKACFEYTNACTSTTVTPSVSSKTHTIGDSFTEPTFTLAPAAVASETLTYSSSNEDIATVAADGTVTFQGMAGTVKITASYAGGEVSSTEYCASEGYYTITVTCPGGAPKVVVTAGTANLAGCNASVTLSAKTQGGGDFSGGSYQWYRGGEEIEGATSASITLTQTGVYTVEYTKDDCTSPSTNSITVTSGSSEPEVERLVPFQYYHVDKTYSDFMKMRHLFAVKNSSEYGSTGRDFKLELSRNGGAATDVTSSNAIEVWQSADHTVDTVMIDLNKLSGKYAANDELVFTCKAIDCEGNVSNTYKNTIQMHVIGSTPTLALICSGAKKDGTGTRKTSEMTVGGDFLTGWNPADLCVQTGGTAFDDSQEWGLYTELKAVYTVTPVNGYAEFNKLNYEPFDIIFLTDYPKSSRSETAQKIIDDMSELCDYRPLFSFKTHFQSDKFMDGDQFKYNKWTKKGFTTAPVADSKNDGRLNLNIVCYAHPMFETIKSGEDVYEDEGNESAPLVYKMLSAPGYEGEGTKKGMQGFEIAAAENFVTIGLTHHDATITYNSPNPGEATWSSNSDDRMLVTVAERQTNIEARMILFSLNAGAHSKLTDKGELVVLKCLEYLLDVNPLHVADCSFTFDNGASNEHDAAWYSAHCATCTGTKGDGLWSTAANWAPDYILLPGEFTSVRIAAPVEVNLTHAHVMEARIVEGGKIVIPAGKALEVKSTIRRWDGAEISPTENSDIYLGSNSSGNGSLIFNNDKGDSKATVAMYTTAKADTENNSAATSTWQYIGTPHTDVVNAQSNYYDSWLYQYDTGSQKWVVIPNGGPLVPFRGYCVTHPEANHTFYMGGTLAATTTQDITIPAGKYVVVANSWVAPIDLNTITDDDMDGVTDKTIYFFNTGSDPDKDHGTGTAAGTYRAAPIHAASWTGDWQIPSLQGFYVVGGSSDGVLHLEYDKHVRPTGARSIVNNPMYAPRRVAQSNDPEVAKLTFCGHRYHDRLFILEREDFTRGYDSGWDGEAWGGNDAAPMSYVSTEGRKDAVSSIPEFEGTVVGFRAGEDDEYTINFVYSEDSSPLYLYDTETKTYSQVVTGNAYYFTTSDKAYHDRFILTRTNGQGIGTGCENIENESTKVKKFIVDDKLFILVNGLLYDATGKVVK